MVSVDLHDTRRAQGAPVSFQSGSHEVLLAELGSILFTSLPRSDQYRKGTQYLRGLVEARGRKSVRNLAALLGEQVSEQNLHHFISGSTWDWTPVRQALAHHLVGVAPPRAWVVQPMIIPKTGRHSVGVDKHFSPLLGQVLNAQRAIGVWAVSEDMSTPVNWRLHLPRAWLKDDARRSQVSIPDEVGVETRSDCVVEACLETVTRWDLPVRPVVLDVREAHAMTVFERLGAAGMPLLGRVTGDLRLAVRDSVLPGHGGKVLSAYEIMNLAKDMRRPVAARSHGPRTASGTDLAAAVRVGPPDRWERSPGRGHRAATEELLLLGTGDDSGSWPAELWLTTMTAATPAALTRLAKLTGKVDRDFAEIADRVGIRDYSGRSFGGWHRHVTLASAAHAVVALSNGPRQSPYRSART
ncbi:IS701 family transposase [Streptomyces liangshanensis]|uniref:IS701 family transposase n=1 Tax=Streptomyces liangshanensis TaxID=2717324 RepID=UPI001FB891E5|nr:transposase [Streptomyces liangshanensis]